MNFPNEMLSSRRKKIFLNAKKIVITSSFIPMFTSYVS